MPKRHIFAENHSLAFASPYHHKKPAHVSAPAPSVTVHGHKQNKTRRTLSGLFVGFVLALGPATLAYISILICPLVLKFVNGNRKGNRKVFGERICPTIYSPLIKKAEDFAFLEKEDALASMELIGKGGCGEVYKAELPGSNGKTIAVKTVILPSDDIAKFLHRMRQIESEIKTVGQIRHRNFIPLLAHLSKPDCHYLVYEFMKNGGLDDMFKKVEMGEMELDWLSRHKIALGIVAGLEYLNTSPSVRILYRDLKPANILLDDDMEAKITDFRLAKIISEAQTNFSDPKGCGTLGYMAPEVV